VGVHWWEARLYPTKLSRDPVAKFLSQLHSVVYKNADVLDIGAGAGKNPYNLKGNVRSIVGADLDPRVAENPMLDSGVVIGGGPLPFADDSFDVIFSIYVLEHISQPAEFVMEIRRVLRPGGVFLALTPNRYHYVPLISTLTPTAFHKWLNKRRGRESEDTFPTVYKMNTRRALTNYFRRGFRCESFRLIEVEPHYLKFSTPTFLLGALYERLVNSVDWLASFRVNIICAFRKTDLA
jgi:SAM-dependent methyltransferase